jgi:membrane protease YdiL (CAAX protease family)
MALGWVFRLDANAYLLLGVPITVAFQLGIRRRPLYTLWVRDAARFRLDRFALLLAASLAVAPIAALGSYVSGARQVDWIRVAWLAAALLGAFSGGFAFRRFTPTTLRHLASCMATAGVGGVVLALAARAASATPPPLGIASVWTGLRWLLLYLPVTFVLEEVFFRGAVDAHVHREGESRGLLAALFVSAVWGLWHLPLAPSRGPLAITAAGLVVVHSVIGIPLSIYWRRSGNLAVPGTVHALVNGFRNALLAMGR